MALFFLLTVYGAIRSRDAAQPSWWQAATLIACALGMACKRTMAVYQLTLPANLTVRPPYTSMALP
jgi:4-amino-4-deoxy-L-arabinose transferase-like glycosyltransferase